MNIDTERLLLRKIKESDTSDIFEYSKEENVGPNAGWKPHENMKETREIMQMIFLEQETVWGIVLKETRKMIGSIGLVDDPKRENSRVKMIGYAISEGYWGKGIMTEAIKAVLEYGFEELQLKMVSAYCYPFNKRSKRIFEKMGFHYEGTLAMAEEIYNGNVYDNECYALCKKEYC